MEFPHLIGMEATRRRVVRGGLLALAAGAGMLVMAPGTALAVAPTITAGPPALTNNPTATFEFSADPGATFECFLDGATVTEPPCVSSVPYSVSDGQHTFWVFTAGTSDRSSEYTWTVDTTPPAVAIDSGPNGTVSSDSAQFEFSGSDTSGVTFSCTLDGSAIPGCTSPQSLNSLTNGPHTFIVTATDEAVNSNTASRTWTIDLIGPATSIDSGPSGTIATREATFSFSASEANATFECRIDASGWIPCTSSLVVSNLAEGPHTFAVRARDVLGNYGAEAARSFTVELPKPVAPSAKPLSSLVLISGRTVKITKSGFVSVFLNCSGTKECAGRLILSTSNPVRASKKRKRIVRLGSAKFRINPAKTKKVRVRLSKQRIRLVRKMKRLKTDVIVRDLDRAGRARLSTRTIVLRAPR